MEETVEIPDAAEAREKMAREYKEAILRGIRIRHGIAWKPEMTLDEVFADTSSDGVSFAYSLSDALLEFADRYDDEKEFVP